MPIQNINTGSPPQTAVRSANENAPKVVAVNIRSAVSAEQATVQPARQPSANEVRDAVSTINKALRQSNRSLEFSVDDATQRLVVKMVDMETGEVVRQIPSEETLAISRAIKDWQIQNGTLLNQKA